MTAHMKRAARLAPEAAREDEASDSNFTPFESIRLEAPDRAQAEAFLKALDRDAKAFTFQTFDDDERRRQSRKDALRAEEEQLKQTKFGDELSQALAQARRRHSDPFARIIEGPFGTVVGQLQTLNAQGAGVYVTVNRTPLNKTRTKESIQQVRAVFADLDGSPIEPVLECALRPHIIVQTSQQRFHAYWLVEFLPLKRFESVQRAIAARFHSDRSVNDLPRVMRLPGFYHRKRDPFRSRVTELRDDLLRYSAGDIHDEFCASAPQVRVNPNPALPFSAESITEGQRNPSLLSIAGRLRGKGLKQSEIESLLFDINLSRCKPPLSPDEVLEIAKRYEATDADAAEWGVAEPIPNTLPAVKPFDPNALLPTTLAPWIEDIADRMQCPLDYVGVAAMVACGSLIGSRIAVRPKRVDDWHEVPNLWGFVVGQSGDKKTPAIRAALGPLYALQETASTTHHNALAAHQLAVVHHQQNLNQKKNLASKGKHVLTVQDLQSPMPPAERRYIVNDTTVEALGVILQTSTNGVLCNADELAGLLARLDGEERRSDRAFYLEAYNGKGSYSVDRITRDRVYIPNLCISILGTSQPDALRQYLRHAVLGGYGNDGLVQRFQLAVYPDRMQGTVNIVDRAPDPIDRGLAEATFKYLDALDPIAVGAQGMGRIPTLGFDDQAQPEVDKWMFEMETVLRQLDAHPALISHYSKFRKTVPTLALIIHLAEHRTGRIALDAFRKALAWVPYLRSHAKRIYASVTAGCIDSARTLGSRIEQGKVKDGFTLRDVIRCNWSNLTSSDEVHRAAEVLLDLGWLRVTRETTGGRPTNRYWINPSKKKAT